MATRRDDDQLERTGSDDSRVVTYAKWGLMGLGALTAIGLVGKLLGLLLNPVVLLVVVAGAAGWWFLGRRRGGTTSSAVDIDAAEVREATPRDATRSDVVVDSLKKSRDAAEAFDRRMRELEALRGRMRDDDDDAQRR